MNCILLLLLALPGARAEGAVAIVGANVLPMVTDEVLLDHTVVVEGGRIVALGPADQIDVPEGALVVDGAGRYVMPGLVDMHVHTWFPADHLLFLANGVTTVRNMFGSPMHLQVRDAIAAGERLGPTILTAGPIVDGDPPVWRGSRVVKTAKDGRQAVREQFEAGYDFVKVYNRVPREAYESIVATAMELGIPVMGHVPDAVGIRDVLDAGQRTIEHLGGYEPLLADVQPRSGFLAELEAWGRVDSERFAAAVERTVESGAWNCPTLIVMQKWLDPEEIEAELERPSMRYVPQGLLGRWKNMERGGEMAAAARAGHEARARFTRALHEGGARIVLGTDQGNPYVVAGFSVHEELANLVAAGLEPYDALRSATRNAAECLEATDEFGAVAVGLRADLLVLEEHPFAEVANAARRVGVMVRGQWLPEAELQERLEATVPSGPSEGDD